MTLKTLKTVLTMPTISRRTALVAALGIAGAGSLQTVAAANLPIADALADALAKTLAAGKPLLVMVSLEGCPHCKTVRDHYLVPLREREGLAVVQVDMRSKQSIRDFRGTVFTHDELIRSWGVKVAPSVLFFGRGGAEVAERLVGGYIPDFYGAYLDERLRTAVKAIGG